MKLWLVLRALNDQGGYDTYDSIVVVADTEAAARLIHPCGDYTWTGRKWKQGDSDWSDGTRTAPGTANDDVNGVLCASFNAG